MSSSVERGNERADAPTRVVLPYLEGELVAEFREDGLWHVTYRGRHASSLFVDYALTEVLAIAAPEAIRLATQVLERLGSPRD